MKTIKCKCGFDSGVVMPGGSIGDAQERSGMIFVFLADGESTWICPKCNEIVQEAARVIVETVGSSYVNLNSLLRKEKK